MNTDSRADFGCFKLRRKSALKSGFINVPFLIHELTNPIANALPIQAGLR
jgi:hypothetical protein